MNIGEGFWTCPPQEEVQVFGGYIRLRRMHPPQEDCICINYNDKALTT